MSKSTEGAELPVVPFHENLAHWLNEARKLSREQAQPALDWYGVLIAGKAGVAKSTAIPGNFDAIERAWVALCNYVGFDSTLHGVLYHLRAERERHQGFEGDHSVAQLELAQDHGVPGMFEG